MMIFIARPLPIPTSPCAPAVGFNRLACLCALARGLARLRAAKKVCFSSPFRCFTPPGRSSPDGASRQSLYFNVQRRGRTFGSFRLGDFGVALTKSKASSLTEASAFLWATGVEDTFITDPWPQTGRTLDEYELTDHYRRWRSDLDLMASLGVRTARYGIP